MNQWANLNTRGQLCSMKLFESIPIQRKKRFSFKDTPQGLQNLAQTSDGKIKETRVCVFIKSGVEAIQGKIARVTQSQSSPCESIQNGLIQNFTRAKSTQNSK